MKPYLKKTALAVAIASCLTVMVTETRSSATDTYSAPEMDSSTIEPQPEVKPVEADNTPQTTIVDSELESDSVSAQVNKPELIEQTAEKVVADSSALPATQVQREQPSVDDGVATRPVVTQSIPESFRNLAAPQTTVADFYYGGRSLGSMQVTYTHDTVEISDPEALTAQITDIKEPGVVIAALSGRISSNPAQACATAGSETCGRLSPEIAGVIYNADQFRADIFIGRDYLVTRTPEEQRYLPESDSSIGMIHGLTATASGVTGTDNDDNSYSLFGNSVVGWKENHLVSDWDYTSDNDLCVDSLFVERDAKGMLYGAGYLNNNTVMSPEFSSGRKIRGARIGTSTNSRTDLTNSSATPLQIFTTGRSRVEVYRDNRLIYATTVEAGSQQLDTSSFPNGSYNVDIRIYEGSVLTQELTRFFVKSVRIPPSDEFLWYLEGGDMLRRSSSDIMPESMNEWLVRGAFSTRVTDNSALTLVGSSTSEERAVEAELFYQGNNWELSGTGMLGNNSAWGTAIDAYALMGGLVGNYYYRKLSNGNFDTAREAPELLGQSFETHSLSLGALLLEGNLNYSFSSNRDQDNTRTSTHSLSWFKNVWSFSSHTLGLQLNYSQGNDDKLGMITLSLRRSGSDWNYNVAGQSRWEQDQNSSGHWDHGMNADARWYNNQLDSGSLDVGVNYDGTGDNQVIGGDLIYDTDRFGADLFVDHTLAKNESNYTNYIGRFNTSIAVNSQSVGVGGNNIANSAVMIGIDGSEQSSFEVLVNDAPMAFARGGTTTVVPLTSFDTYNVAIRPRGDGLHDYDTASRTVTLYPGNVESLDFNSRKALVLLGKLVNEEGEPLANYRLSASERSTQTDEFGIFQIRVPEDAQHLQAAMENDESCTVTLPEDYRIRAGIGMVGSVSCEL